MSRWEVTVGALGALWVVDGELVVASGGSVSEGNEFIAIREILFVGAARVDDDGPSVPETAVAPALEEEFLQRRFNYACYWS